MTLTRIDPHLLRYGDPGIDRRNWFGQKDYLEKEICDSWVSLSERSRVKLCERQRLRGMPPRKTRGCRGNADNEPESRHEY